MRLAAVTVAAVLACASAAVAMDVELAAPAATAVVSPVAQPTPAKGILHDTAPESELGIDMEIDEAEEDGNDLHKRYIRGGHNQYGHWQRWWTRGAKRDVSHENDKSHHPEPASGHNHHGPPGGESGAVVPVKRPSEKHDGIKRDVNGSDKHKDERGVGHWFHGPDKNGSKWNGNKWNGTKSGAENNMMGPGGRHDGDQHDRNRREAEDEKEGDVDEQPAPAIERRAKDKNGVPAYVWEGAKSGVIVDKRTGVTLFDVRNAKITAKPKAKGGK